MYSCLPQVHIRYRLCGGLAKLSQNIIRQWMIPLAESNPGMLQMLRDRDALPYRSLLPWSGEFCGKHLTACAEIYILTRDEALGLHIGELTSQILAAQAPDGYIGPWAASCQLTGNAPNAHYYHETLERTGETIRNWDAWDFYHLMLGMLEWHLAGGDPAPLEGAEKLARLLDGTFWQSGRRLSDIGTPEANLAPIHALCLLHRATGEKRYLEMAFLILEEFKEPGGGDYLRLAAAGAEFYQTPLPRWESLHPIMGLAGLYGEARDAACREAFERLWWSMLRTDRHNTGGFTSGEAACGDPYCSKPIETCCTVAWMAMSVEMLKLTGEAYAADELELSFYNAALGAISPSGRWCTYNTPMEGARWSSLRDISFQSRPGTPELNCCSVNAPRALGLLSQWGVQSDGRLVTVNFYGAYSAGLEVGGKRLLLCQETAYPGDGKVRLSVSLPDGGLDFVLRLRIPGWSENTRALLNGAPLRADAGSYLEIGRAWRDGDAAELLFDFSLRYWMGEQEYDGKCSIYRGPLLLAWDRSYSGSDEADLRFDARNVCAHPLSCGDTGGPVLLECRSRAGKPVILCDFRSAGYSGCSYRTWFDVQGVQRAPFSARNPGRTSR